MGWIDAHLEPDLWTGEYTNTVVWANMYRMFEFSTCSLLGKLNYNVRPKVPKQANFRTSLQISRSEIELFAIFSPELWQNFTNISFLKYCTFKILMPKDMKKKKMFYKGQVWNQPCPYLISPAPILSALPQSNQPCPYLINPAPILSALPRSNQPCPYLISPAPI